MNTCTVNGVDRSGLKLWQRSLTGSVGDVAELFGAKGRVRLEDGEFYDDNQGGGGYLRLQPVQRTVLMVANDLDYATVKAAKPDLNRKQRKALKACVKEARALLILAAKVVNRSKAQIDMNGHSRGSAHDLPLKAQGYLDQAASLIEHLAESTLETWTPVKLECVCSADSKCEYHRRIEQGKLTFPA